MIDAAPVREEKPFQALLSPHREEQRMWRALLLRCGLEPEVCVVTLEPAMHDLAMALLAKGEADASEDGDDGEVEDGDDGEVEDGDDGDGDDDDDGDGDGDGVPEIML